MREIFFNITGTVLVLNVLFLLIPDGKFEKYVRFTAGLIVILTIAGNFVNISIDHSVWEFDKQPFDYNSEKLEQSVKEDLIEKTLEERIEKELGVAVEIEASTSENKIKEIAVWGAKYKTDKVIDTIMHYCDINRERVVVK